MTSFAQARHDRRLLLLPLHLAIVGALVLVAAMVLSYRLYDPDSYQQAVAVGCALGVVVLVVYARYGLGFPWLSASVVYLMLFWMFHYGLAFTAVMFPGVLQRFQYWETLWLFTPNARMAMLLGLLGAAGFVSGLALTVGRRPPASPPAILGSDWALYGVGWLVMLVGLGAATFTIAANGGLGVLGLSYMEFRMGILGATGLQTSLELAQLGCVLALCGAGGRQWIFPLAAWAPLGLLLLLVGLRGEAMVPAVTFMIVLAHRGIRLSRSLMIAAVLAALVIIPAMRTIRNVGVANRSAVDWTEISPLETFTELGGTLRAVKVYIDWIERGDDHLLGSTYWAPFDRQLLTRVIPGRESIPYDDDARLPERFIEREGSIGLAATGEAYYNFGTAGPFIYFGCVGMLFGWLERRASRTPYHCAALGMAMGVFYYNIRSHWLFVPAQTAIALVPVGLCYAIQTVSGYRIRHAARA